MSTSLSSAEAPNRNRCGCSHSSPAVSATVTRYLIASFELRMPPAGFTPIFSPVSRCHSCTICSMSSVTGRVAAGCTLPVEVLMKSPPARIASQDARRTLSYVFSSPVSRMTLRLAYDPSARRQASLTATISSKTLP